MALFNSLQAPLDLARYLSALSLQNAAQQYIPTMAQEAEAASQMQNVWGYDDLMAQYNVLQNDIRCAIVPAGWRDWFDCGDELV